jgi:hypothetical protein
MGKVLPDACRPLPRHRPPDLMPGAVLPRPTRDKTLETGATPRRKFGRTVQGISGVWYGRRQSIRLKGWFRVWQIQEGAGG